jgi:succinate dehydrogenase / fumarate reductase iron-sulfur subunit
MINVKIFRFDPDADPVPYLQDYRVADDFRKSTILEMLDFLKRQDSTLQFRRPNREDARPADGMNVNGENRLAHETWLGRALGAGNTVVLRPLTGRRVVRDLVVEMP